MNDAYLDLGFGDIYCNEHFEDSSRYDMNGEATTDDEDQKSTKMPMGRGIEEQKAITQNFESYPATVHFSEWTLTDGCKQAVCVTNCSKRSLRFQIYPPASSEFSIQYDKIGNLAPGLSQTIMVKFSALEYKYYYDCLRIQGEDSNLLIPLHAYPIANKVHFPRQLLFGPIPLCESSTKVSYAHLRNAKPACYLSLK